VCDSRARLKRERPLSRGQSAATHVKHFATVVRASLLRYNSAADLPDAIDMPF